MFAGRHESIRRLAFDRERNGIDVALLAWCRSRSQLASSRRCGSRLRHLRGQEQGSCQRNVRERELRVGFERTREICLGAGDCRENAVRALDVGIARDRRGRRQR
jgi:hypothetical protein